MKTGKLFWFSLVIIIAIASCKKLEPPAPEAESVMDAPLENLTPAQVRLFNEGAEEFDEVYNSATGLGPLFVSNSCTSCHTGDNRGHPFTMLTRFGQSDTMGNQFLAMGGPQLQSRALPGFNPEVIPMHATSSKFIAPIVAGTGFLELVSDADILAMADPNDANGDGISGVVSLRHVPDWVNVSSNAISINGKYITRFGRKASAYNLHQQTVNALNQDMGLTTTFNLQNPYNYLDGLNPVVTSDPEVSDQNVNAVVFYLQALQAPIQRNVNNPAVVAGKNIFMNTGCESCHKAELKTGYSPITALSNTTFHPYTDLLLHDMGAGLDDHYTEGNALTSEWRTAPLWGLGLATRAQSGGLFLLHDGRAHSIEEAILLHGGEASQSVSRYEQLSANDKKLLLEFLTSL